MVHLPPPVDSQLDCLVDDGAPGRRDPPLELLHLVGEELRLAAVDLGEAVLVDEEVLAGREPVQVGFDCRLEGGPEVVAEVGGELGSFVGCGAELVQHGLLGRVQLRC